MPAPPSHQNTSSSLAYAAVGVDGVTVCEYSLVGALVAPNAAKLIASKATGQRVSYSSDKYLFNMQIRENVSVVAVCDNEMKHQAMAFRFLEKVISTFFTEYGATISAAMDAKKFALTLRKELEYHNSPEADKIAKVKEEIESVKGIMTENIDKILERGEKMDKIVDKTEDLAHQSDDFFRSSRTLRRQMFWKNVKIVLGIFFIVSLLIFVLVLVACGGFSFHKCKSDSGSGSASGSGALGGTSVSGSASQASSAGHQKENVMEAEPSSRMFLYLRAEKLADMDTFSKSDPYAVVYMTTMDKNGRPMRAEVGRTERLKDCLSPVFQTPIQVNFYFELKQDFRVILYDDDGKPDEQNDRLGEIEFVLSKVVASRKHTASFPLKPRGTLYITAVEAANNGNDIVDLQFRGSKLKKMDMFGLSDPYFKLYRLLPTGAKNLLFHSKVISNTLDPEWEPLPRLRVDQLTGKNHCDVSLEFECFDEDTFSDDVIGSFQCSFDDLLNRGADTQKSFTLRRPGKTKTYGEIYLRKAKVQHIPTFAEYLRGGFEINLTVSIDFTGSNGNPQDPRSLHYMNPSRPNNYVRAIESVGSILMQYDTDHMVPLFGFGAVVPGISGTSMFFHVNMQANPYVQDVPGVLQAYSTCLPTLRFSGPTNFAPTLRAVTEGARKVPNVYTILLILTDGEITDMDQTIDAIVEADDAPLSIVIVGVGHGCDFQMMDRLDADEEPLRHSRGSRICRRDLVQFVPFRNFENAPPHMLAAEVLREVPEQFVRWARLAKIDPPMVEEPAAVNQTFQPELRQQSSWIDIGTA